jgi:2-phosphosulfolactate phosphatase
VRIDVHFTPAELAGAPLADSVAVVIDVLRATSTIVEALANGARCVIPVTTPEAAVRVARGLADGERLLTGERGSVRIDGFQLGNSPAEFTSERVGGKRIVMSTTNGTPALVAAAGASRVVVGSFLNLSATVAALAGAAAPVVVICAGKEGRFALEDALCAGLIVAQLQGCEDGWTCGNDAARAATALAVRAEAGAGAGERVDPRRLERLLMDTAAARQLHAVGHGADVALCAAVDRHALVPSYRDGQVEPQ